MDDQRPTVAAGHIGTPVAEYNAPDAEDYVEQQFGETEDSEESTSS